MKTEEYPDDMILCATGKRAQIDRDILSFEYWMYSEEHTLLRLNIHAVVHPGTDLSNIIQIFSKQSSTTMK